MVKAKKSLSQNFIFDKNIGRKIVKEVNIFNKLILEIGPGYGFITDLILENKPKKVLLVEKDFNLIKHLKNKYKNNNKVEILGNDILKTNLSDFKNLIIISNLPYNISTKIILYLFEFNKNISKMVLMIQKEVAEKFDYNLPKMNKYKFLTKVVSSFSRCFNVSSNVFVPKPKIKSTVVKFVFNKKNFNLINAKNFSKLIFRNVRKKIYNNIKISNKKKLLEKRVDELSIKELLDIYNFF